MIGEYATGRVAVFIDAANILYSQKTLGWRVDYKKLKQYLLSEVHLVQLYYYTGHIGIFEKQSSFLEKLREETFTVVSKEVKMIRVAKGKYIHKGNLDIELALDAYRYKDTYDTLLLFSGDSDYAYLLDLLKGEGKGIMVVSTRGHISRELIMRAKYIDLRKIRKWIEYKKEAKKIRRRNAPEV